jgi:Zn-dependent protease with chaperone function
VEYQNPKIPEGINTSKNHPLKDFALLLIGISVLLVFAVLLVSWSLRLVGPSVPFNWEQAIAQKLVDQIEGTKYPQRQAKLQQLANNLSALQGLPDGMTITVHYSDSETVNALATLGGHVVIFQGLIDILDSENALAMVIAHEIAHVKYRHPIVALGRALGTTVVFSLLGASGNNVTTQMLSNFGFLAVLSFNREQESESDISSLSAVNAHYGHTNGANGFFVKMQAFSEGSDKQETAFFSTHPNTERRIEAMSQLAEKQGWLSSGTLTPLEGFN